MSVKLSNIRFLCAALMFTAAAEGRASEYANAVGIGLQYGGLIGWQGSFSQDHLHGRFAVGLLGLSVGGDVDINNYASLGATLTTVGIASFQAINLNFYPSGRYTSGFRIGLEAGSGQSHLMNDHERGSFVAASIGYAFN